MRLASAPSSGGDVEAGFNEFLQFQSQMLQHQQHQQQQQHQQHETEVAAQMKVHAVFFFASDSSLNPPSLP